MKIYANENLWDIAKAVLRRKFVTLNAYIIKKGKSEINKLSSHLKKLEQEEKINPCQAEERKS